MLVQTINKNRKREIHTDKLIFGVPMNRNEAVTYLKELLSQCSEMSLNAVSFEEQRTNGNLNYRLHIKGSMQESDKQLVREIAKKHSLEVKDNTDGVVVYNLM